jgi:hypothetical protein
VTAILDLPLKLFIEFGDMYDWRTWWTDEKSQDEQVRCFAAYMRGKRLVCPACPAHSVDRETLAAVYRVLQRCTPRQRQAIGHNPAYALQSATPSNLVTAARRGRRVPPFVEPLPDAGLGEKP